jgi:hypothetical protein
MSMPFQDSNGAFPMNDVGRFRGQRVKRAGWTFIRWLVLAPRLRLPGCQAMSSSSWAVPCHSCGSHGRRCGLFAPAPRPVNFQNIRSIYRSRHRISGAGQEGTEAHKNEHVIDPTHIDRSPASSADGRSARRPATDPFIGWRVVCVLALQDYVKWTIGSVGTSASPRCP